MPAEKRLGNDDAVAGDLKMIDHAGEAGAHMPYFLRTTGPVTLRPATRRRTARGATDPTSAVDMSAVDEFAVALQGASGVSGLVPGPDQAPAGAVPPLP